jgi:hypothetical protein
LAPHLTEDNHHDVLTSARHKGKREVEQLVASLRPIPAVASTIRKLPEPRCVLLDADCEGAPTAAVPRPPVVAPAIKTGSPTLTPLAPERYKVRFTISRETQEKLRRVQALARHAIPSGDPAEILDRALTLLLRDLVLTFRALGPNLTDTVVTRRSHTLVTRGPYRFIRHPLYDAAAVLVVAVSFMMANWFALVTGASVVFLLAVRSRTEEDNLLARFGDSYRTYCSQTGRFFPKIR